LTAASGGGGDRSVRQAFETDLDIQRLAGGAALVRLETVTEPGVLVLVRGHGLFGVVAASTEFVAVDRNGRAAEAVTSASRPKIARR